MIRKLATLTGVLMLALILTSSVGAALAAPPAGEALEATELSIKIAPNTLQLASEGEWLTVHTDIPLSSVNTDSLTLNDIAVSWTKADNQGNLVAKFSLEEVKAIVAPPEATLTLDGSTLAGEDITGTATIAVK